MAPGRIFPIIPGSVDRVVAIDCERMQPRLVQNRIATACVPITPIYQDASRGLPFDDNSFDTVVTTYTLCSIDDVGSAVREIARVLKPNGSYLFLEHGRSADAEVQRRQNFFAPAVRLVGAGCRMNREIDRVISEDGLQITALDRFQMPNTPRILGEMYMGVAIPRKDR